MGGRGRSTAASACRPLGTVAGIALAIVVARSEDFRIDGRVESGGQFRLRFPASTSDYYLIQAADSLGASAHLGITDLVWGVDGTQSWADPGAGPDVPRRYYRVAFRPVTAPGDADADGLDDVWELRHNLRPLDPADAAGDPDGDGLSNLSEYELRTNPNDPDTDADSMPDGWEARHGLNPADDGSIDPNQGAKGDPDGDESTNIEEYETGTDPRLCNQTDVQNATRLTIFTPTGR